MTTTPDIRAELADAAARLDLARKALRRNHRISFASVARGEHEVDRSSLRPGLDARAEHCGRPAAVQAWYEVVSNAEDEVTAASTALVALKIAAEPWLSEDDARLLVLKGRQCELR